MDLKEKKIVFLLGLCSPYGGNIIPSLVCLAELLRQNFQAKVFWVFPKQNKKDWLVNLEKEYPVYYTSCKRFDKKKEIISMFSKIQPDIAYSHFSTYNIAVVQAVGSLSLSTKVVWHIHSLYPLNTPGEKISFFVKIRRILSYIRYYRFYGKNVYLIAVSAEAAYYAEWFKKHWLGIPTNCTNEELNVMSFSNCKVLLNGIDTSRLNLELKKRNNDVFTFLSFGGIERIKKIELLVRAAVLLRQRILTPFKLLITEGIGTREMLLKTCGEIPEWIELVKQTDNVSELYSRSSCYVSTSLRETMSTSIAEATFFDLPVIQSDILGTYWNAQNPSVLLFRSGDIEDLTDKIEKIINLSNDKNWQSNIVETRQKNMTLLSLSHWREEVLKVLKGL